MSSTQDGESEDAGVTNYPSPGADGNSTGVPFFSSGPKEGGHAHEDSRPSNTDVDFTKNTQLQAQHGQPLSDALRIADHEIAELHQQNAGSSAEQGTRPPNLEELRLAAQLGHGLTSAPLLVATDPNMTVEDPSMRSIMPHPDPEQHQAPPPPPHTEVPTPDPAGQQPASIPMGPPSQSPYAIGDYVPPRKRSKVSRACDECRRKKVKCDATTDTGEVTCSNCTRTETTCLFSRVPQKRGPSKG